MNRSIEKLTTYLQDLGLKTYSSAYTEALKSNIYNLIEAKNKEELMPCDLDNYRIFMKIVSNLNTFLTDGENFYNDFFFLDTCLIASNLSAHDKLNIITYVIQKNINNGILERNDEAFLVKLGDIDHFDSIEEVKTFLHKYYVLSTMDTDKEYTDTINSCERIIFDCKLRALSYIGAHDKIKEIYLDKLDSYSNEDILKLSEILKKLKFSKENIDDIKGYLSSNIDKRNNNKNKEIVIKKHEEIEVKRLDVKEQNKIYREIMSMYDIDLNLAIKPLNLEEIIYLVSLMKKINISDKEILLAIKNIYKSFTSTYTNPLYEFNVYYEKMNYLSDNEEVKNAINYIKEIIPLILIPDDNKSYSEWMREISKTIADIKPILNENYEYELEKGKNR
jgi:hypothetical protein